MKTGTHVPKLPTGDLFDGVFQNALVLAPGSANMEMKNIFNSAEFPIDENPWQLYRKDIQGELEALSTVPTGQLQTQRIDLHAALHAHGVHCTAQRRAIWEFFTTHPRGHAISEAVEALRPHGIGQTTVYRTVDLFVRLGLLAPMHDDPGKLRYVAICPGHCHTLICQGCHAVVEFSDCDISLLEKLLAAKTGYTIQGHHLEMYGICPRCIEQKNTEA